MRITSWEQLTQPDCPAVFSPEQVRQVRELAGCTPAQMASMLNVSRATISRWENGHIVPSLRDCLAMRMVAIYSDVLGVDRLARAHGCDEAGEGCHAV